MYGDIKTNAMIEKSLGELLGKTVYKEGKIAIVLGP